jgi:hypothetical protein
MTSARDALVAFIESEGHRTEATPVDGGSGCAEIVFRTRGQTFSVTTFEREPGHFRLSAAYEVPDRAYENARLGDILRDIEADYPSTRFVLAHDDTLLVAAIDCEAPSLEAFAGHFWELVGRLREAGAAALERLVDRSESKAAADKFIRQFTQHGEA